MDYDVSKARSAGFCRACDKTDVGMSPLPDFHLLKIIILSFFAVNLEMSPTVHLPNVQSGQQ